MKVISIVWRENAGEAKVTPSKDFNNLTRIDRLDCLQDAICDLEKLYNRELNNILVNRG